MTNKEGPLHVMYIGNIYKFKNTYRRILKMHK